MMESNFYSDEFEELIRGKTEQYKMYPSEKVWKGVHGSLHTKRRWYIMGMSLLIMGILFFAGKELIAPAAHPALAKRTAAVTPGALSDSTKTAAEEQITPAPILRRFHGNNNTTASAVAIDGQTENPAGADKEDQTYRGINITLSHLVINQPDLSEFLSHTVRLPSGVPALPVVETRLAAIGDDHTATGGSGSGEGAFTAGGSGAQDDTQADKTELHNPRKARSNGISLKTLADTRSDAGITADHDTRIDSTNTVKEKNTINFTETIADQQKVNWLADYAVYNLPVQPKRGRQQLQLYFSPTVSYRSLSGGGFSSKSAFVNVPMALNLIGDAKNYVDHNPSLGFSVGGSMQYRLTRNLTVKGGLQFSFSRYTIKAYASNDPMQTTIALNSYYGYYLDSITAYSNIRNLGGKTPVSLNNDYYQLAAPVGFELRVMGNERLQLNIGATIQPTYRLNNDSYMLTTDYTSYVKEPSLMRRWNVNGALEAFLSYKTRSGLRWQIGPEFRYQMLSTYDTQYPLHEHLKGYGIKFGIVKPIP